MTNFNEKIIRYNYNSVKWSKEEADNEMIPLTIADMDFKCPLEITKALRDTIEMGIYGYTYRSKNYYESIKNWMVKRHNIIINEENIIPCFGVMPAINAVIRALSMEGDAVLINTPAYYPFFSAVTSNKRKLLKSPLVLDKRTMQYYIDFDDLERKLKQSKIFVFCSPHNPTGRVWNQDELSRVAYLCRKYNVTVIADEVYNDLILANKRHTPFIRIADGYNINSVSCLSPSKTFNLSGFNISYNLVNSKILREKVEEEIFRTGFYYNNIAGLVAIEHAYNCCEYWLEELLEYLRENNVLVCLRMNKYKEFVEVIRSEGTYLMLIRFQNFTSSETAEIFRRELKILVEDGSLFECDEGFVRLNIACPRDLLNKALDIIEKFIIEQFTEQKKKD